MTKQKVDHHASVVVVISDNRICHGGYDEGYPREIWRNHVNLLGGNHESCDYSPRGILEREITEEFSLIPEKIEQFAPESEIIKIRKEILGNAHSYGDFLVTDPDVGQKGLRESLVSFYASQISADLMSYMEETLASGKRFASEGLIGISPIDSLVKGDVLMAWCSPVMLGYYLKKEIPNPHNAEAVFLGNTRETLVDYLKDFEYTKPVNN